jgi:hypothetical protein
MGNKGFKALTSRLDELVENPGSSILRPVGKVKREKYAIGNMQGNSTGSHDLRPGRKEAC